MSEGDTSGVGTGPANVLLAGMFMVSRLFLDHTLSPLGEGQVGLMSYGNIPLRYLIAGRFSCDTEKRYFALLKLPAKGVAQ